MTSIDIASARIILELQESFIARLAKVANDLTETAIEHPESSEFALGIRDQVNDIKTESERTLDVVRSRLGK